MADLPVVVVVDVERLVAGHDISLPVKRPRTRLLLEAAIGQQRVVAGISPGEEGLGQVGRCAAGGVRLGGACRHQAEEHRRGGGETQNQT